MFFKKTPAIQVFDPLDGGTLAYCRQIICIGWLGVPVQEVQKKLWLCALEKGNICCSDGQILLFSMEEFQCFFFWAMSYHCTEGLHLECDLLYLLPIGRNFYSIIRKIERMPTFTWHWGAELQNQKISAVLYNTTHQWHEVHRQLSKFRDWAADTWI